MASFSKGLIFRESCYDCQFNGLNRVGDISIADFWGIGKYGMPFRHDVTKGVSLVLVNNSKGDRIVKSFTNCFMQERDIEEAIQLNHNLIASSKQPDNRMKIIEAFNNPDISLSEINDQFGIVDTDIKNKIINYLTKFGLIYPLKSIYNKLLMLK